MDGYVILLNIYYIFIYWVFGATTNSAQWFLLALCSWQVQEYILDAKN